MRNPSRKLTDDPVVLRILEEIKLQEKTEKEVEEGIGLTSGAFTRWKYEDSKSYMRYIGAIAEYLNVTADYLLDTEDTKVDESTLTGDEIRLVKMFRKVNERKRRCMLKTGKFFLEHSLENMDMIELYLKKCNEDEIVFEKVQ